jgi:hypothetical protein
MSTKQKYMSKALRIWDSVATSLLHSSSMSNNNKRWFYQTNKLLMCYKWRMGYESRLSKVAAMPPLLHPAGSPASRASHCNGSTARPPAGQQWGSTTVSEDLVQLSDCRRAEPGYTTNGCRCWQQADCPTTSPRESVIWLAEGEANASQTIPTAPSMAARPSPAARATPALAGNSEATALPQRVLLTNSVFLSQYLA